MSRLLGRRGRALVLVVVLVVVAACTDDSDEQPAPTTRPTTPSSVVDRSGIALARVPGETTTTIVDRGTAVITGGVQGPGGLVPRATVRIERLVAGREVRTDVVTGPDGRYVLSGVPGGRYRLRAFMAPSLVQLDADIRFLADGEEHVVDLRVEQQGGLVVRADVAPDTPVVGEAVNLVATVGTRTVSRDGVVTTAPVAAATVELEGLGHWVLRSPRPSPSTTTTTRPLPGRSTTTTLEPNRSTTATARTDGSGLARFELLCAASGAPRLSLRVPVAAPDPAAPTDPTTAAALPATAQTVALELPDCVAAPTAAPAVATTTTAAPSSTTTTSR